MASRLRSWGTALALLLVGAGGAAPSLGAGALPALVTVSCSLGASDATAGGIEAPSAFAAPAAAASASPLALAPPGPESAMLGLRRGGAAPRARGSAHARPVLDAARARILLQSLTVPGWGQATLGARRSATVFALAEASVWASFTAFRIQQHFRIESSERTAALFAGIRLEGRDDEFHRIVGGFISSEEYNRLVVFRDAANLYYDDPVAYRAYIAAHQLTGSDAWAWDSEGSFNRYRAQRQDAQRAARRANTALALAIANRLLSALHAARIAGRPAPAAQGWNIECVPVDPNDPSAFHLGVRTRF